MVKSGFPYLDEGFACTATKLHHQENGCCQPQTKSAWKPKPAVKPGKYVLYPLSPKKRIKLDWNTLFLRSLTDLRSLTTAVGTRVLQCGILATEQEEHTAERAAWEHGFDFYVYGMRCFLFNL